MDPKALRAPRWLGLAFTLLAMFAAVSIAAWTVEFPYFAMSAGPVSSVTDNVTPVSDIEVYPPHGELMMLTVSLQGVNGYEMLAAAMDPTVDLLRQEAFRSPDETDEEYRERNLQSMDRSKENAIAVALERIGLEGLIESDGVAVVQLVEGAPSAAVLQEGDIITSVEGVEVDVAQDIGELLSDNKPGDIVPVTVQRGTESLEVGVELTQAADDPERPLVGITATTINPEYPVDINSSNVGGPSAGLMYTLGIIDLLTPGDLTHGHVIAGTGTMNPDGTVGSIGGIRQKVVAAEAAGAEIMFVPANNYEEALTAPRQDIELVSVTTVDEALSYLTALPEA
jgi:PDZ domain-containing protein